MFWFSSDSKKNEEIPFKEKHTFEERLEEARRKKQIHPGFIPIIIEKHKRSKLEQCLEKPK